MGASVEDVKEISNMLFVTLPTRETFTTRRLPENIGVLDLKANLELLVGVPSFAWELFYGDVLLSDEDVVIFGQNVRNCAILKVVWKPEWELVCDAAITDGFATLLEQIVDTEELGNHGEDEEVGEGGLERKSRSRPSDQHVLEKEATFTEDPNNSSYQGSYGFPEANSFETPSELPVSLWRRFLALYIAGHRGRLDIVRSLIKQGVDEYSELRTDYGRTVVHAAAASDQSKVLEMMASQSVKLTTLDLFGRSPLDVAISHGAYTSERALRNFTLRHRHKKGGRGGEGRKAMPSLQQTILQDYVRNRQTRAKRSQVRAPNEPQKDLPTPGFGKGSIDGKNVIIGSNGGVYKSDPISSCSFGAEGTSNPRVKTHGHLAYQQQQQQRSQHPHHHHPPQSSRCGSSTSETSGCSKQNNNNKHKHCHQSPPFLAFRSVPAEELRPLTVEYVPLDTTNYREKNSKHLAQLGYRGSSLRSCPDAPNSSLNNSLEDISDTQGRRSSSLEKTVTWVDEPSEDGGGEQRVSSSAASSRQELRKTYTFPQESSTTRAQSAMYYKTKYHHLAAEDRSLPKPRPATAGPRYREWKVWLLENYSENGDVQHEYRDDDDRERKEANAKAFQKWLRRKRREEDEASDDSSSSESVDPTATRPRKVLTSPDSPAYKKWLEKKREVFEDLDRRRKHAPNSQQRDPRKRVTVFEIGDTNPADMKMDNSDRYLRAYQTWVRRKKQYETWKKKKGLAQDDFSVTNTNIRDVQNVRKVLALDAMTYEEWLGQKHRENSFQRTSKLKS